MRENTKAAVGGSGHRGKNLVRNLDSIGALSVICDNQRDGCAAAVFGRTSMTVAPFVTLTTRAIFKIG